jgi:hydroxymethylbilane synthase
MPITTLRIATRRSPLALWQAEWVRAALIQHHPQLTVELLPLATSGDLHLATPLAEIGGKGLFVKELEQALLDGRADIAVHSMKDVPAEFPAGLALAAIPKRQDPRDAFISLHYSTLMDLPRGARVGTASVRRACQLLALRGDLEIVPIRGNVDTRLNKLQQGTCAAIVLAAAGLRRLGLTAHIRSYFPIEMCLPAAGQGALAIEARENDPETTQLLTPLIDAATTQAIIAERACSRVLEGSCQVPLAAYAEWQADKLWLRALVGSLDGKVILRQEITGATEAAMQLGTTLGQQLLAAGAKALINASVKK